MKTVTAEYRTLESGLWVGCSLLSAPEKSTPLSCGFQGHSDCFSSIDVSSLAAFTFFLLLLVFRILNLMHLCRISLSLPVLSHPGFSHLCVCASFDKFGKFSFIFLQVFFQLCPFSPPLLGFQTQMPDLVYSPSAYWGSVFLPPVYLLLYCADWTISAILSVHWFVSLSIPFCCWASVLIL